MTAITGAFKSEAFTAAAAASTASSLFIYKMGYAMGTLVNPSAVARTYTFYGCYPSTDGTTVYGPWPLYDQDGIAVAQTLGSSSMWELPSSVCGAPILEIITSSGASTSTNYIHFER